MGDDVNDAQNDEDGISGQQYMKLVAEDAPNNERAKFLLREEKEAEEYERQADALFDDRSKPRAAPKKPKNSRYGR